MARRPLRGGKSNDKLLGIVFGIAGLVLIAALAGGAYWLKASQVALDKATNCPLSGPVAVHVFMFDRSDAVSGQQAQGIRQVIHQAMDTASSGTRFDVYTFDGDSENVLLPTLALCVPPRPGDASELTANPARLRKAFETRFTAVLDKTIDALLTSSKKPTSPIIESLRAAAQTSFGATKPGDMPIELTLISDMVQHSVAISHFRSEPNFEQLSRTPNWASLRPQLKSASTTILYVLRPNVDRGGKSIQNRGHQNFWERLITEAGGKLVSISPI